LCVIEAQRAVLRRQFRQRAGWHDADESLLAGDASFRRYYRLRRGNESAVVMDAPPPLEDVRPFIAVARHLQGLGFSAPAVLADDPDAGFLLLEDLGDDTFARVMARRPPPPGGDETSLYALATDVLVALHGLGEKALLPGLSAYAGEALIDAAMLLPEWYLPAIEGRPATAGEIESYRAAWREVLAIMPAAPDTLLLRDFHQDNLMWLPQRSGIRACGLLDFQDAQRGHPAYDLMSLIEDARRDIDPALHAAMLDRYLAGIGVRDRAAFKAAFAILGAQRHARVIGLFVRLLKRDGKPVYLPHLPRVWGLFERSLAHEALTPLRRWVDRHVPPAGRVLEI
jgi:aminoglycoside/choline kinase family phosphotransferase